MVKENGVAAYAQLNRLEEGVATGDLDLFVVPSAMNLGVPHEIPNLPSRRRRNHAGKTYKTDQ